MTEAEGGIPPTEWLRIDEVSLGAPRDFGRC